MRLELGGAGVHHLIDGAKIPLVAQVAYLPRGAICQLADFLIGEAETLGAPEHIGVEVRGQQFFFHQSDVLEGAGEPGVDAGFAGERFRADAAPQGVEQRPEPFVVGVQGQARFVQAFQ